MGNGLGPDNKARPTPYRNPLPVTCSPLSTNGIKDVTTPAEPVTFAAKKRVATGATLWYFQWNASKLISTPKKVIVKRVLQV